MSKKETISKVTRALADSLKAAMEVGDAGAITVSENWYRDNLPESLDMNQRLAFQEHDANVVAALAVAAGESILPKMADNPNLTQGTAFIAVGADRIGATVMRDFQHGKETVPGWVVASYEVNSVGNGGAEFGHALAHVRAMADSLFTK